MNPRNSFPHKLILLSAVQTCICHHLCTACCAGHYHVGQCWAGHCCTGQYWAGRTIISYHSFTSCTRHFVYISPYTCHACVKLILRIWNTFGKGRRVIPPPSLSGQDHQVQGLRRPHTHNISLTTHYISKKDNLKLALYLSFVGRHIHSSELYMGGWRISGSLYVYDTLNIIHKDAQRHQMHDSH